MENLKNKMLGDLIGLARATDGSEHLINPDATALIRVCLGTYDRGEGDFEELITQIDFVKRQMIPDCYLCANPCGKTSPFNMEKLKSEPDDLQQKKQLLLQSLCRNHTKCVDNTVEKLFYQGLIALGIEYISISTIESITSQLDNT